MQPEPEPHEQSARKQTYRRHDCLQQGHGHRYGQGGVVTDVTTGLLCMTAAPSVISETLIIVFMSHHRYVEFDGHSLPHRKIGQNETDSGIV